MNVITPTDELVQRAAWFTVFSMLFRFPDEEIVQHVKTLVAELPPEVLDAELRPRVAPFKQAAADAVPGDFVTEYSDCSRVPVFAGPMRMTTKNCRSA